MVEEIHKSLLGKGYILYGNAEIFTPVFNQIQKDLTSRLADGEKMKFAMIPEIDSQEIHNSRMYSFYVKSDK